MNKAGLDGETGIGATPTILQQSDRSQTLMAESLLVASYRFIQAYWGKLIGGATIGGLLGLTLSFVFQPRFRSEAQVTVAPSTAGPSVLSQGLGSIASSLGFTVGGGGTYSPELVTALVGSRDIVDSVLRETVPRALEQNTSLEQYLAGKNRLTARDSWATRKKFLDRLEVSLDVRSGVISLSYWDHSPQVAVAVLGLLLNQTDRKLIEASQTLAAARRDYLKGRLSEFEIRLSAAEDSLTSFRTTNRSIENSPVLQLQSERLTRRADLALEMNLTLEKELDAAELQMRSDVPQLTIVEHPNLPERKYFPRRAAWAVAGACILMALLAFRLAGWPSFRQAIARRD